MVFFSDEADISRETSSSVCKIELLFVARDVVALCLFERSEMIKERV